MIPLTAGQLGRPDSMRHVVALRLRHRGRVSA